MYFFLAISTFLNAITATVVGIFVLKKDRKNPINISFAILCASIGLWAWGYFFPLVPNSEYWSLVSFRLLHVGAVFIGVANLHFVSQILGVFKKHKPFIIGGYIFNLIVVGFIPTRFFITGVVPKYDFSYWAEVGIVYTIWLIVWTLYLLYTEYLLFVAYRKSKGIQKLQIKYLLLGETVAILGGWMNFPLFYGIKIPPYSNVLVIIEVLSFAYIIARYRFLSIQDSFFRVFRQIISVILSAWVGSVMFSLFIPFVGSLTNAVFIALFFTLLLYLGLQLLWDAPFFHNLLKLNRIQDWKDVLFAVESNGVFYKSIRTLQMTLRKSIQEGVGINSVRLEIFDDQKAIQHKKLVAFFKKNRDVMQLVLEEEKLKQELKKIRTSPYLKELAELGDLLFPIFGKNRMVIGFFILGKKKFENPYTDEEIIVLRKITNHIALAISILQYHQNLTEEVKQQTAKIEQQRQRIEKSYEQLQQLDTAKDSFLSIASHELRTPMTIIKGYSDFLLSGQFGKLNETQTDFVGRIFKGTENLIALVNDILDLSKLEADRMPFKFSDVSIKSFLQEEIEGFQLICKTKKIKLKFTHSDTLKDQIKTDPDKLKEIMNNLLGNAYKFTPDGGTIMVHAERYKKNKKFLQINIEDSGVGIPDSDLEIVFERFSQVENYLQKEHTGTGLGLTIVKKIIEKLGGKIWVEAGRKVGANFIFLIPYKK